MSRIGKQPITIPTSVDVKVQDRSITVKGPKGTLSRNIHESISVSSEGNTLKVEVATGSDQDRKFQGLTRSLINNMVIGVKDGFSKSLSLVGVGYRAAMKGTDLNLTIGFSHPVDFKPPQGIDIKVEKATTVVVSGADKELVGQVAAKIRAFRPPEPYHGKGVRYSDEHIATKVGKGSGKK